MRTIHYFINLIINSIYCLHSIVKIIENQNNPKFNLDLHEVLSVWKLLSLSKNHKIPQHIHFYVDLYISGI